METANVEFSRTEALRLFREYKKHQHYSTPIDTEVASAYQAIAKGRMVIRALESIRLAGLRPADYLPKLAITRATATDCWLTIYGNGAARMSEQRWPRENHSRSFIDFGPKTFLVRSSFGATNAKAAVPLIPIHLRPKRGLASYHILWEAEWQRLPPVDPMLLRRIGKSDLWIVCAHWELTEVEQAALATRIR